MDAVVEPVFLLEKCRSMHVGLRRCASRCSVGHCIAVRAHALVQAMQIATSAERFVAGATQYHAGDLRILSPDT